MILTPEQVAKYTLQSLEDHNLVFVHVEATDEASYIGDGGLKIRTIEDPDEKLLSNIMNRLDISLQ